MNPFQTIQRFDLRILAYKVNYYFKRNNIYASLYLLLGILFLLNAIESKGQACDPSTPSFNANLTGQPNGTWFSPEVVRDGNCCTSSWPDRCIEFWVTLDPAAEGIRFFVAEGAMPNGALYYQINCGPMYQVGVPLCLSSPGPHRITFCKPGSNQNIYGIQSIGKPSVSGLVTVSDGCKSSIYTQNFDPASITWRSISPGTPGQYNSYLTFPVSKETAVATYQPGAPPSVTYEVCGVPLGGCSTQKVCLNATVNFVTTLAVNITPTNPTICFGGSSTPLTANVTGGTGPYTYTWTRNGANVGNTQVIDASTTGTYTVVVADATSCPSATNSVVVTSFTSPITANAGPDKTSCANNPSMVLSGSVQQASGGIWSGGAGTYSPSKTSLTPTYTPTAAEITAGSVTFILASTGNGTCPGASDQMILTIAKTPIVSAGPNQSVCANNTKVTLAGSVTNAGGGRWSGGAGAYFPNDSTLNAVYTPTAAEITAGVVNLTLKSIQNGNCLPVTSTTKITITPAPTVNANVDQSVCSNKPNVTLNGSITVAPGGTWSGGAGTFVPNANTLNAVYTPTTTEINTGSVTLTLTANQAGCLPVTDQMVITITPAPTVNAGSDQTICKNNATVSLSGAITVATGGTWSGGTGTFTNVTNLNTTYTPSTTEISSGTVTLTLTTTGNSKCNAVSDQIIINLTPAPTVNAGPDQVVCANNATTALAGSVTIATGVTWSGGAGTFSPNQNALNASYTPTASEILAGGVTLTLTTTGNGNCLPVTDQVLITITPAPIINAGPDLTICANKAVAQLSGTVTVSSGAVWSGGNGTYSPNNTTLNAQYVPTATEITNGIVHLTFTSTGNGKCIAVSDNMVINITPAPTVDAGSDQTLCGNVKNVSLNGTVTVAMGGQWSTAGTGTFSPDATTLNATYTPSAAEIATGTITLTLTTIGNGNCNAVSDQMIITYSTVPLADAGPDKTICTNDFPIQLTANGSAGSWVGGTGTFTPSRNLLNPTYTPSASEISTGSVTLTFTTNKIGSCLSVSDNVIFTIPPGPVVNSGPDQTVCADINSIPLIGSVSNAGGAIWTSTGTGTFSPNATTLNASYIPTASDTTNKTVTLTLTSTSNGACTAQADQMIITFTPAPIVNAGSDQTYCADITSLSLNGAKTVATGAVWSGGAGTFSPNNTALNATYTPTIVEKNSGTLTLTLTTTGNGTCNPVNDKVTFTFTPAPTVNAGNDQTICADAIGVSLSGAITVASGGMWTSSGSGIFTPNEFALNATYVPSVADTTAHNVQLTLTTTGNGTCIPVSDQMVINILPKPVVNAGPNITYCSDIINAPLTGIVLHATGGQWTTAGTGTFNPNSTTLNASYVPSSNDKSNGSVILTLTSTGNGTCNAVTDRVRLRFTPAPTIDAGVDIITCATSPSVLLNASVTIATGGTWTTSGTGTFSNPNSLNPTYNASNADTAAHSVILTITSTGNGTCIPVSDNLTIKFDPKPIVNAGPDNIVCGDVTSINLNGSVANATGVVWSGGSGTFSPSTTILNPVYSPSASESTGSSVTLTLTTTGNGSCPPSTDQRSIITLTPSPTVDAGANQIVCADIGTISIDGTVTVATGGNWTSSGTGTFANPNNLITTYAPSAADISNGTVILTLTTTGNGTCKPVSDQITITITPSPSIDAGSDVTICADQANVALNGNVTVATGAIWSTSGSGTFFPDNTNLNAYYLPSAADTAAHSVSLTLTSTGNGTCIPVSDTKIITILPAPYVNAGPDITYCSDIVNAPLAGTIANATGGQWITLGTGTFNPDNTSLNAVYVPSAADKSSGSILISLSSTGNGICNAVTDQVFLNFTPAPTINAGSDQTVCASSPSVALNATVTVATGGSWTTSGTGTFSDPNSLTPTYTPSAADTTAHSVTLTVTSTGNGTCIPVSDNLVITFDPTPIVNAGPDVTVCGDVASINLNGSVTHATGGDWSGGTGTFNPNSSTLNTAYTPTTAESVGSTITLTLTTSGNATCPPSTDQMVITITPVPTVNAGTDQTVCADIGAVSINGTVTVATGGNWTSSGSGTFANANNLSTNYTPSASDIANGSVVLTLTTTGNGTCNPVIDQLTITITSAPTVNAGPDQTICADLVSTSLNGSVTVATGGTWSTSGSGTFLPDNTTLTSSYSPSVADTAAHSVKLILTSTNNGTCQPVRDSLIITILPSPVVNAGLDKIYCSDIASTPLSGTILHATGGQWTTTGTGNFNPNNSTLNTFYTPSAADKSGGLVTFTLTSTGNGLCNAVTDQVTASFSTSPTINAGADQTVCASSASVALNASVTVATGGTWTTSGSGTFSDPNSLTPNYTPSAADTAAHSVTLIVTSTGNGTCIPVSDNLVITFDPTPIVNAGTDVIVCGDVASINLNGSVTHATGGDWSGGTGTFSPNTSTLNATYSPTTAERVGSSITLTLTSSGNATCPPSTDQIVITITPVPTVNAGTDQTVCADIGSVTITGAVTVATGGSWTSSGTGTFANANNLNTNYTPSASDISNGSVVLTLTTIGNGTCNPVNDQLTITITPAPTVNAGPDQTICADLVSTTLNGSVTVATGGIWSTSGSGTFLPDNTTLSTSYSPSAADTAAHTVKLILTSTSNGTCKSVKDSLIINILPIPIVNAGTDQIYCSDIINTPLTGAILHATGGQWTTSGTGNFSPNNSTLNTVYTPSAADKSGGLVTFTLTSIGNGLCSAVSDQVIASFSTSPTINAGVDQTVCATSTSVALNASVTVATGGTWTTSGSGTFSDPNSLTPNYTPSTADTAAHSVTLTVTSTGNGTCIPVSDNMIITFDPKPIVNAGPDATVCGDVASINLNGSVTHATGGNWSGGTGTFNPNTPTLNATYSPTAAERVGSTVTLTLTTSGNATCPPSTDQMVITITPVPTVNAGTDQTVCADIGAVALNGTVTVATGGTWTSSGTGTFNNANSLNASYTPSNLDTTNGSVVLTLTTTGNGTCNPVNDQLTITITPAPTINAGPDQTICADLISTALNGSVTVATGGAWSTSGSGTFLPDITTLTTSYSPSAADTAAHSVKLILTSTGNGTCKPVKDSLIVNILPSPVVNAGSDIVSCSDIANAPLAGTVLHATGGQWTSSGTGSFNPNNSSLITSYLPSASDKTSGMVTLTLTSTGNGLCNTVTDQLVLNLTTTPTIDAGADQTICATSPSVVLNASVTVAIGGTWTTSGSGTFSDPNSLTPTYTPSPADTAAHSVTLIVTSTGNGTCIPVSDNLVISFQPTQVVNSGSNQTVCASDASVTINGSVVNATGGTWTTSGTGIFGDANALSTTYIPSPADTTSGSVTLTLTSTGNALCSAFSSTTTIGFRPVPTVNAGPVTLCTNMSGVTLSGTVTNASGATWTTSGTGTFSPSGNILTPNYSPTAADKTSGSVYLYLTATGTGICTAPKDSILLGVQLDPIANAGLDQTICGDLTNVSISGVITNATGGTWTSSGSGSFIPDANTMNAAYNLSASDITNGTVTLMLTSNPNGICPAVSDQMIITITPTPTVAAGPDQTICADANGVSLNGTVTVASGGTWTSLGSGSFTPNANTLTATYVPSAADTAAHSVELILTTTGNGTCNPVKDSMIVTITPAPTLNVGPDQTICADLNVVNLNATSTVATGISWTTTGSGTFTNTNTLVTQYTTTASDTISGSVTFTGTTTGNGTCNAVTDNLIITITPAPTISASAGTACSQADTIQLSGVVTVATGAQWTTSGTGTFIPSATNLNAQYLPSAADKIAGTVNLLLTSTGNGTCNPVTAPVTITILPSPIADAGPDQTVCADIGPVSISGTITNASGGLWSTLGTGNFTPSTTSLSGSYTISNADTAAHTVSLVLTTTGNGLCKAVTDTMMITILPAPVVNAGPDQLVCGDAASIQMNGLVSNAGGGIWTTSGTGTFSDANILNPSYQFSSADTTAGTVTLNLTSTGNGTCNAVSDQLVVTITDAPTVNAGPDQTICADASGVSLNGIVTVATGGIWTTSGSGSFTPNATTLNATYVPSAADTAAHSVQLILITTGNGTCNPVKDTMMVNITPAPTINVGPDQTICADLNVVNLNATSTVAAGISWTSTGSGTFSSTNTLATQYTTSSGDTTAGSVTFTGTTTENGTCNAVTDNLILTITPAPTISASAPTACADMDTIQLAGTVTVATGVQWTTSGTGIFIPSATDLNAKYLPSAADKAAGTVNLLLTSTGNGSCNSVSAPVILNILPAPIANAGTDQTVCADIGTVNISGAVTNASGGVWSTLGTGNFTPSNTSLSGSYNISNADTSAHSVSLVLTTTGNGLCKAVTDTMLVTILPAPVVNAGPDQIVCGDANDIQINGVVANAGGGTWVTSGTGTFSDGNILNPTYLFSSADTTAGSVTLTLTSTGNGTCNAVSDQLVVTITNAPTVNAGPDQTICADAIGVSLIGTATIANGIVWTSSGSGSFTPNATTLNTTYVPSAADTAAHSVQLNLTTTGNGTCNPVKDSMIVTITPAPTLNVGPDQTICADLNLVNLNASTTVAAGISWTTSGSGTFTNTNTLATQYTTTAIDTTSGSVTFTGTTTGNGTCNAVTDNLIVTITPAPTITASAPTACADMDTIQLTGTITVATGAVWTTSGTGIFFPSATDLNAKYLPSVADKAAGTVNLLLTSTGNGTCNPVTASVILNILPAPIANAGTDQTVCADIGTLSISGTVTNATGGTWSTLGTGTFVPDNVTLNGSYNISNADTTAHAVSLILTTTGNGLCKPVSDTVLITILPTPVVNAGPDQIVCGDASDMQLNGVVANAGGGTWVTSGTGSFSDGNILNPTYQLSTADTTAGTVTLTLTSTGNGTCNAVSDQLVVTITDAPQVNAGTDQTICADASGVSLNSTATVASGIIWTSSGSGTFTPDATTLNATYILSAADTAAHSVQLNLTTTGTGTCKAVKDSMIVNITPAPTLNVGPDQIVCGDVTASNLNASITTASGISWTTTGSGTFSSTNSLATQYTISSADSSSGLVKFIGTTTGNGTCNAVSDTLSLTITPGLSITASAPTACANMDTIQLTGTITVATGAVWTTSGTGIFFPSATDLNAKYLPSAADKTSGTVNLLLTSTGNGTCKQVSAPVTLTILPAPIASAGIDQTVCADIGTVNISGTVTNAIGGIWSTLGTGTFTPDNVTLNGTYNISDTDTAAHKVSLVLTTTGNSSCKPVTDTMQITILPAPVVNAGPDQLVCGDASTIQLNATIANAGGGTWITSGTGGFSNVNSLNPSYTFSTADTTAGTVTLTLTSTGNGTCNAVSDQLVVTITDAPTINAGPDQTICADASGVILNSTATVASGILWTSSGSGTFTPDANTLNSTYVPSAADTAAHNVQLTLTTVGTGTCNAVSDVMAITITPAPIINVGPDQIVCGDVSTTNLNASITVATGINWTTTGSGTFTSTNTLATQYTITSADSTSGLVKFIGTTTGNGTCKAVSDTVSLTITPGLSISASAPTACADMDTIQLTGNVTIATGALWITSGTGTFFPSATNLNAKYLPSVADKNAGTVNLLLTSTGNGTCKPVSAPVTLTIIPAPIANAGADNTVCADIGTVSISGSVTNAGGGIWSTLGTGSFIPDNTTLNNSYNLSNADTTAHSVKLVLTTTGNGVCKAVSDTMQITILPAPVVNAGPDQTVCGDAASIQANGVVANAGGGTWTTSGTGTFSNGNILNPTYQFSSADTTAGSVILTLTSTANGTCNAVSDEMIVTFTDAPQVSAGSDQTICADASGVSLSSTSTVASGVLWTSSGTGTFTPDANTLNAMYVPSAADTAAHNVQLNLTTTGNGTCKAVSDAMNVTITPAPTIRQIPDQTICSDASSVILNGNITVASGGVWTSTGTGSFTPDPKNLSVTYTPSETDKSNGLVNLTLTTTGNGTCNPVSMVTKLTITPAPTVKAGPDITICNDSTSLQISGTKTVASGIVWSTSGSGTFIPDANTLNALYLPSASDITNGKVDILLTTTGNGTCLPVTDDLKIDLTPAPTVNAGPDQTICANSKGISLNGSVTVATGGSWLSKGSGTFTPDANGLSNTYIPSAADTAAKSVTLILSTTGNGTCKVRKDTLVISIDPLPIVSTGAKKMCSALDGILLNGHIANATGGIWTSTGTGNFTPSAANVNSKYTPSAADVKAEQVTLTLTTTGNGACSAASSTMDLVTVTKKPLADAGPDQRICIHTPTTLNASQTPYVTFGWYTENNSNIGNSQSQNVTVDSDTSFVLSVTDTSGCITYDTMNVFIVEKLNLDLAPHYCFENGKVLDGNPAYIPTAGTFVWYNNGSILVGENTTTTKIKNTGEYVLHYNYGNCSYADTTLVTPLPVLNGTDKYACAGTGTILSTSPVGVTYQWNTNNKPVGTNNDSISVTASNTPWESTAYIVIVTDQLGCKNNDTVNVNAIAHPNLSLVNTPACTGDKVTLQAQPSNINPLLYGSISHYQWEKDKSIMKDTSSMISVSTGGTYTVVFNIGECHAYDTSVVTFYKLPVPDNQPKYTFCSENNGSVTLDAGPSFQYDWLNAPAGEPTTNRTIIVHDPGVYQVKLINENNCFVIDSILAANACAPQVYNPESFTPGIPGGNSKYFIKGVNFANFEIFIYNRWGEIIFHTTDPDNAWDGTYRGEIMPPGVYPYTLSYTGDNELYEDKHEKEGSITLIR